MLMLADEVITAAAQIFVVVSMITAMAGGIPFWFMVKTVRCRHLPSLFHYFGIHLLFEHVLRKVNPTGN